MTPLIKRLVKNTILYLKYSNILENFYLEYLHSKKLKIEKVLIQIYSRH